MHGSPGRRVAIYIGFAVFVFPCARNPIACWMYVCNWSKGRGSNSSSRARSPWRVTTDETITSHMLTFGDGGEKFGTLFYDVLLVGRRNFYFRFGAHRGTWLDPMPQIMLKKNMIKINEIARAGWLEEVDCLLLFLTHHWLDSLIGSPSNPLNWHSFPAETIARMRVREIMWLLLFLAFIRGTIFYTSIKTAFVLFFRVGYNSIVNADSIAEYFLRKLT